ncbi:MAG: outer membrane lipoprotein carrier protein LolA [Deltaproteobacteria bacterium]|nr:outer membrane lipoprotein carrier protein LolA [Deltaproteobacteria bacterium]MBW1952108.1 outer membrane lipoprotein carrier protein LolA [Deltaproteobacteria bacterium]MBW1987631.1 outer membrane lipoprotein carrier protein LolA [Deltaproteobacteria bacterium]MBW2135604.1 outer membrane lipoprotein carrier protein LolA [Deltaproteobacteria bacterium]
MTIRFCRLGLLMLPVLLLLSLLSSPAVALTPQEVVAQVQQKYDITGAFKAYFRQVSSRRASGATDTAEGWVYFRKPCQMRWEYLNPPGQRKEVIADGQQVWIYIPQDHMVWVYPLAQVMRSDLVMRFFSGMGNLQQDFTIAWRRPYREGVPLKIDLRPVTPQPDLKWLALTIDPQSYQVQEIEFANAYGDLTHINFSQLQLNIKLPADFFSFTPPPGVEVVKEMM